MKTVLAVLSVGIASVGFYAGEARAAAMFTSDASLTATLSLGNGDPLSSLAYAHSSSFYHASTEVATSSGFQISAAIVNVDRAINPPVPFDQVAQGVGLATLLFSDESHSMNYPEANAVSSNGIAHAKGLPSGEGVSYTFSSDIFGAAFPESGHAVASLVWEGKTSFTNLTSEELLVIWTVNYSLSALAQVDDTKKERALTETQLFASFGSDLASCTQLSCMFNFIAAADPPLDPPISMVPIRPNPKPVLESITYTLHLAPGASDSFSLAIDQFGVAQSLPLPSTLLLFLTGLSGLIIATRVRPGSSSANAAPECCSPRPPMYRAVETGLTQTGRYRDALDAQRARCARAHHIKPRARLANCCHIDGSQTIEKSIRVCLGLTFQPAKSLPVKSASPKRPFSANFIV